MQLGFQIKYITSNMLDLQGSQLAYPAASANTMWGCWLAWCCWKQWMPLSREQQR